MFKGGDSKNGAKCSSYKAGQRLAEHGRLSLLQDGTVDRSRMDTDRHKARLDRSKVLW